MPVPDEIDVYFNEREPPIRCCSLEEVDATLGRPYRDAERNECPLAIAITVVGHEIDMGLGPTSRLFACKLSHATANTIWR